MQKKNSKHMFYKSYALVIIITGEKTIAKKGVGACDREFIQKRIPCMFFEKFSPPSGEQGVSHFENV